MKDNDAHGSAETAEPRSPDRGEDIVAQRVTSDGMQWHDAQTLDIEGRGWQDVECPYARLPASARSLVPQVVWEYSRCSSGLCVRFVSNARRIVVCWHIKDLRQQTHMSPTGIRGIDLYAKQGGVWRFVNTGMAGSRYTNSRTLIKGGPQGEHEYLLYFPLFSPVEHLSIGIDSGAFLRKGPAYASEHELPLCFYGTSLTQGACASRPGITYPAILGRRLQRPILNLGFSASGKMESAMADLMSELTCSVYILDCIPNMTADLVAERVEPFVRRLHITHPHTPIVLVGSPPYPNAWFFQKMYSLYADRNAVLYELYDKLTAEGVSTVTLIPGEALIGTDGEASVANHATDLAFMRYANVLTPIIRDILLDTH